MAQHNRNWIFSWFLPALTEKQCSSGDCWSESVNEGRRLSPYTSFSPAQGVNIPWCTTAFLCFLATSGQAANCSWSWQWGVALLQTLRTAGRQGVWAAQGLFYAKIHAVLPVVIYLFSSPELCLYKTKWTEFKYLSLDSFQKQTAFYIDLYNVVLGGPSFQSSCVGNQIHLSPAYL